MDSLLAYDTAPARHDALAGLPGVGIQPRVCIGSRDERNKAIGDIHDRAEKGCVLDPIIAALVSDFHLWDTISEVCCPIHVTHSTLEVFAKREIEAKNNIDRQTGMTSWQEGHLVFNEISEMLGASAGDSIFASEGNELLLLSEGQGLRQWATGALSVKASWLQPALLIAKDRGLVSIEDDTKFLVDCLNRQFTHVSLDSHALLTQAKADAFSTSVTIRRMLEVLGGKNADLESNLEVAANFLDLVFQTTEQEFLRNRYASLVMEAFCAPRKDNAVEVIKHLTRQVTFRAFNLLEHA